MPDPPNQPEDAPMDWRARTRAANRAALLQAGRAVFATQGFDAATVRDVVRASGLSPGTFYNNYPDKGRLLADILGDLLTTLRPRLVAARASAGSVEAFVGGAFQVVVAHLLGDPQLLQLIARSGNAVRRFIATEPQVAALVGDLRADLERSIAAGLLPPVPVAPMAAAMLGATVEVCLQAARDGRDPDDTADFLARLFIGGILQTRIEQGAP